MKSRFASASIMSSNIKKTSSRKISACRVKIAGKISLNARIFTPCASPFHGAISFHAMLQDRHPARRTSLIGDRIVLSRLLGLPTVLCRKSTHAHAAPYKLCVKEYEIRSIEHLEIVHHSRQAK